MLELIDLINKMVLCLVVPYYIISVNWVYSNLSSIDQVWVCLKHVRAFSKVRLCRSDVDRLCLGFRTSIGLQYIDARTDTLYTTVKDIKKDASFGLPNERVKVLLPRLCEPEFLSLLSFSTLTPQMFTYASVSSIERRTHILTIPIGVADVSILFLVSVRFAC